MKDPDTPTDPSAQEESRERSKIRWRTTSPDETLTWGRELSGEAFIAKAESYGAFGSEKAILEVGPGYGRLLRECLRRKLPFQRYVAIDISTQNVEFLKNEFGQENIGVILGDVESTSLDESFDVLFSSLTFKHLYPSFEQALRNIERHLNSEATLIFDLVEGDEAVFEHGGVTYNRSYSRAEVTEILQACSLELHAFDEVQHDPDFTRLLVVARKR